MAYLLYVLSLHPFSPILSRNPPVTRVCRDTALLLLSVHRTEGCLSFLTCVACATSKTVSDLTPLLQHLSRRKRKRFTALRRERAQDLIL